MSLIERYIYEVGKHLPRKNRADIQEELRSALSDALEDRGGEDASREEIRELLKSFGPPKTVAASYYPEGQYLIGPVLYPLFRMVAGIALAAVIGAQLLALGVGVALAEVPIDPLESALGLLNSIPVALGWVVIVFAILERYGVKPELDDEAWDPEQLPQIREEEPVKRGERIAGIVVATVILGILVALPDKIGFISYPGGQFFANPVIAQYLGWISFSLLVGIGLDIYLLWQGEWTPISRILKLAANLLSIVVLALLVQGHNAWLVAHGAGSFLVTVEQLSENVDSGVQMMGMQGFRLAFLVALVVISIDTAVMLVRLVKSTLQKSPAGIAKV
jgi:hypothetical protein